MRCIFRPAGLPRRALHFSTGVHNALALGEYAVLDIDYHLVQVFDTEEEAEAFVAEANGWDIETVRRETRERGRMLVEYRENLIRGSRERRKE